MLHALLLTDATATELTSIELAPNVNDLRVTLAPVSPLPSSATSVLFVIASSSLLPVSSSEANEAVKESIEVSITNSPTDSSEMFPAISVAVTTQLYAPSSKASVPVSSQLPSALVTTMLRVWRTS